MAFVVFEGLDGSGKSTLIEGLKSHLESLSLSVLVSREPGGTPLAEEIRQLLLRTTHETPAPRTEALLYQASRAQHVEMVLRPALSKGQWVLCDRFTASSVAFQAGGRNLKVEQIEWLNQFSTDGLTPDLWVLLDLPVEEGLRRTRERSAHKPQDRFDREVEEFHQRTRDAYLNLAKRQADKWLVLDSTQKPGALLEQLKNHLRNMKCLAS